MTYVRRAIEVDVEPLLSLCRAFHAESPVHSKLSFSEAKVELLIRSALDSRDWLLIVAVDDEGAIVGTSLLYAMAGFFSEEVELGELCFYVVPAHRGGRAALLMMKEALAWGEAKGVASAKFGITTGINEDAAARFFARFGFARCGILMQRGMPLETNEKP